MGQYDHIKQFVQGYPKHGKYYWRVLSTSGKLLADGFTNRKAAEAWCNAITDLLETLPKNEWYQVAIVTERR